MQNRSPFPAAVIFTAGKKEEIAMRRTAEISSPLMLLIAAGFADNPIVQTIYTADPAPMVYNDTLFCHTSHDEDVLVNNFFTMRDWRCFSTTDMVNWRARGKVAVVEAFSWADDNGAWAPQCTYRNGKFYLYCPVHMKGIGVMVSDRPDGPFTDALKKPLLSDIDPTVFIDDDGQAYLYWGNPNCMYVKLKEDMISYSGSITRVPMTVESFGTRSGTDRPTTYEEGPWLYKRNSLYYLVFAAGPISEHIGYSTSAAPTGPWTYRGVVMPTQGSSFTNHPGVIDYKGNSYLFYHNGALPGGGGYRRSVCVEKFTYNTDGAIPSMNMTKTGAPQIGNLNPYDTTQAETICWESGVETGVCSEGGIEVDSIHNGDYIAVKGVDFGSGALSFIARVSSATSGGNIELRLSSQTGTLVGTCAVQGTGGWQTWTTRTCNVSGATGVRDLYLKFTGGSGLLFNFNWWKFNGTTGTGRAKGNSVERGNRISVVTNAGKTRSLRLDFSPPVSQGNLNVGLFDLTGRLVATLFTGRLSSAQPIIPLDRAEIRPGGYVARVLLNSKKILTNRVVVQ